VEVDGFGIAPLRAVELDDRVVATEHSFTNGSLAVSWDLDGAIVSIIDVRAGREVLPHGRRIELELAPDHPVEYDAWDVEAWTPSLGAPVGGVDSVAVTATGPLLATLRVTRSFGASSLVQDITLRAGSARLDIAFDVDWHEDEQLLSLVVPIDVRARDATCDIQYGHVARPTHPSSPWDAAKFEVCAHRFVDLAEPSWGVAVLNDGRYGHGLFGGGVRVSLLRAAKYPDPTADHGQHRFTISVLPHGPGLHDVRREADWLNVPLRLATGSAESLAAPVVTVDHPGVEVSAVKRADDGSGDLIVRLAEVCGDRVVVDVRTPSPIRAAQRCNALEEPESPLDVTDGFVALHLRPFELATLRLA
jgi:alpha-mannosidase